MQLAEVGTYYTGANMFRNDLRQFPPLPSCACINLFRIFPKFDFIFSSRLIASLVT